jgi:NAD(P)-dependent dehydrogenase (short-subunit alcohol dehydrogenase family)
LAERVAAVLGVGPGLGTAIAGRFAREGYAVGLMARSEESVSGAREEMERAGGEALAVTADATDVASVARAFDEVRGSLGDPEVYVYNAGAFRMGGILGFRRRTSTAAGRRIARARSTGRKAFCPRCLRGDAARSSSPARRPP